MREKEKEKLFIANDDFFLRTLKNALFHVIHLSPFILFIFGTHRAQRSGISYKFIKKTFTY